MCEQKNLSDNLPTLSFADTIKKNIPQEVFLKLDVCWVVLRTTVISGL